MNLNFYIAQNINKSVDEVLEHIDCILDHQFDAHQHCVTFRCAVREEHNNDCHDLCKSHWCKIFKHHEEGDHRYCNIGWCKNVDVNHVPEKFQGCMEIMDWKHKSQLLGTAKMPIPVDKSGSPPDQKKDDTTPEADSVGDDDESQQTSSETAATSKKAEEENLSRRECSHTSTRKCSCSKDPPQFMQSLLDTISDKSKCPSANSKEKNGEVNLDSKALQMAVVGMYKDGRECGAAKSKCGPSTSIMKTSIAQKNDSPKPSASRGDPDTRKECREKQMSDKRKRKRDDLLKSKAELRNLVYSTLIFNDDDNEAEDSDDDEDYILTEGQEITDDQIEETEEAVIGLDVNQMCEFEKDQLRTKPGYYHDRNLNWKTYNKLREILAPCFTKEQMVMLLHIFSTQKCESFHSIMSTLAPKHLFLGGSVTLATRVSIAVGCLSLGHLEFWKRIYEMFGLEMSVHLETFLQKKDLKIRKKREVESSPEAKQRRNKTKNKKDMLRMKCDIKSRKNKQIYKQYIALCGEDDETSKKNRRRNMTEELGMEGEEEQHKRCKFYPICRNEVEHSTSASKHCLFQAKIVRGAKDDAQKRNNKEIQRKMDWAKNIVLNYQEGYMRKHNGAKASLLKRSLPSELMTILGDGPHWEGWEEDERNV